MSSILPPYRAPSLAHPRRAAAEKAFGLGRFQRIAWRPEGPIGACRATVAQALARGGRPVAGWQIHLWPGLFFEALAHYVWQDDEGRLIDLSDKYPGDPTHHSVFVPQTRPIPAIDCHSRWFLLRDTPEVRMLINAAQRQAGNRARIEATIRARLGHADVGLLDHADADAKAILHGDEVLVGAAIQACQCLSARLGI